MKKQNENQFIEKFRFLHSQESRDEISWSCSDSSDYEYSECQNLNNRTNEIRRKRKRVSSRTKNQKNISNLDITVKKVNDKLNNSVISVKSPILIGKSRTLTEKSIVTPQQVALVIPKTTNQKSYKTTPDSHNCNRRDNNHILKSPIIIFKSNSTKVSPKVRKKLFELECSEKDLVSNRSTSPILSKNQNCLDRRKFIHTLSSSKINNKTDTTKTPNQYIQVYGLNNLTERIKKCHEQEEINIESTQTSSEESVPKKSHTELVARVKSYFDNHFISDASQLSISESETPTPRNSSKSSNEIDITTLKTQENNLSYLSRVPTINTIDSTNVLQKKIKYKKGGLAFRLNTLLKKQMSSVTLWEHERFLAANSNFVIPKQEFLVFRIRNVCFKYGVYYLEIVNLNDEQFTVIINNVYVNNNIFEIDGVIKIYEPYKIVIVNDSYKIITNFCKFECVKLKVLS